MSAAECPVSVATTGPGPGTAVSPVARQQAASGRYQQSPRTRPAPGSFHNNGEGLILAERDTSGYTFKNLLLRHYAKLKMGA